MNTTSVLNKQPTELNYEELEKRAFIERLQKITGLWSKWDIEQFLIQNQSDLYNKFQAIEAIGSILANVKLPSLVKCERHRTKFQTSFQTIIDLHSRKKALQEAIEEPIKCPICGRTYYYFISKNSWYADRKLTVIL